MSKIGIFLGFEYKSKIKAEGIGRLLGFMLKADLQQDIVVAMPEWLKDEFIELLKDQDISQEKIELITTRKVPYSIRAMEFYKKLKAKKEPKAKSKIKKVLSWAKRNLIKNINTLISSKNIFVIILMGLYLAIIGIVLLPFVLIGYLAIKLKKLLKKGVVILERKSKGIVQKALTLIYRNEDVHDIIHMLYAKLHSTELESLVESVNKRQDINMWYIPALFWPEVEGIKAKKVIAAPDIVYYDFPIQFATSSDQLIHEKLVKTIKCADHIICYSDYVKYNHIVKKFGIHEEKVTVISHGCVEMNKLLKVKKSIEGSITQKQLAVEVIEQYILTSGQVSELLRAVKWEQMKFVIYSSQLRPHKNILSLIKAIEILNRKYYKNIKLIVTGNIYQDASIAKFISENNMQNEVIQFYNIPSKVLAALNKLAVCAVNPTMFEGGFPFTFTEAYSMQTPSVMSNISVVEEKIDDIKLKECMLFDPYDVDDLVQKLDWAIDHRDSLYNMQADLYKEFEKRTWDLVVEEYIDLFKTM